MSVFKYILIFCVLVGLSRASKHDKYDGYTVHRIQIRDMSDLEVVHSVEQSLNLDVWHHGVPEQRDALIMVPPEKRQAFINILDSNYMIHSLHIENVAKNLEAHEEELTKYRQTRNGRLISFEDYPRYSEVDAYIEDIAAQYPNLVTLVNAGPSYEGRSIKYLKISTSNFTDPSKPVYFMDAMIHAREWVTTPVALYAVHRLVVDLLEQDRDLLEQTDWIILPIVNPDGYEFTHTTDRLWRQTRSVNLTVSDTCFGVDANRNFDVNFNTLGVSSDPCSLVYPGTHAFSDVETQYVRNIMFEHLDRIQLYLNIHSYGNLVLIAYGNNSIPDNAPHVHFVAATMGAAFDSQKLPQADYYLVGSSSGVLYVSSGTARDYAQSIGIPFSLTLELPGYDYQFVVPPQYIEHVNAETWHGIAATARLARSYYSARYRNSLLP